MSSNFIRSSSFKIRTKVSIGIVLVVLIGALTPGAIGLRLVYFLAAILSALEVHTLATESEHISRANLARVFFALAVLAFSIVAVLTMPRALLITGIAITMATDTGAYLVGKICGGKFIKSRPFPTISPKKTWEGNIGGEVAAGLTLSLLNDLLLGGSISQPWPVFIGCLAGFLAIMGDVSESALKRNLGVGTKDANDVLKTIPAFRQVEALLGGSEGHGGYYDRLDSMSLVLLFLGIVTVLSTFLPGTF